MYTQLTKNKQIYLKFQHENAITAHRQPWSALERPSANVVVIIITPLWFDELVQLWFTHLSGLIKTVWVKDFLGCTAIFQAPPASP